MENCFHGTLIQVPWKLLDSLHPLYSVGFSENVKVLKMLYFRAIITHLDEVVKLCRNVL